MSRADIARGEAGRDLARMGRDAGRGVGLVLIFLLALAFTTAILSGAAVLVIVVPLELLPFDWRAVDGLVGRVFLAVAFASVVIAWLMTSWWRRRIYALDGDVTEASGKPAESVPATAVNARPSLDPATALDPEAPSEVTFPVRAGLVWRLVGYAPVATACFVLPGLLLLGLAVPALVTTAAAPPRFHLLQLATMAAVGGVRLGWVGWRLWRDHARHGPARLVLGHDAITMIAAGDTTRIAWHETEWVGIATDVPPRRQARTLVARLVPGVAPPPAGQRLTWRTYEPHPRWYPHLGVVRICDLTVLAVAPPVVAAAVERFSGGRWRGVVEPGRVVDPL